jgi:hypothetical protein
MKHAISLCSRTAPRRTPPSVGSCIAEAPCRATGRLAFLKMPHEIGTF